MLLVVYLISSFLFYVYFGSGRFISMIDSLFLVISSKLILGISAKLSDSPRLWLRGRRLPDNSWKDSSSSGTLKQKFYSITTLDCFDWGLMHASAPLLSRIIDTIASFSFVCSLRSLSYREINYSNSFRMVTRSESFGMFWANFTLISSIN